MCCSISLWLGHLSDQTGVCTDQHTNVAQKMSDVSLLFHALGHYNDQDFVILTSPCGQNYSHQALAIQPTHVHTYDIICGDNYHILYTVCVEHLADI